MESTIESTLKRQLVMILPWVICILAAIFYLYEFVLRVSPSVMSHELMSTYHLSAKSYGNLTASYYYIYAPMQIVVGLLIDRYGPRRLLTVAALASSLGIYFFASTQYLVVAEIGRIMVGLGAAFAFVGVLKLATIWLPRQRFALFVGITVALGMLGAVAGDFVLTELVITQGWKLACYAVACCGVLLTALIFLFVRDRNERAKKSPAKGKEEAKPDFRTVLLGMAHLIRHPQIWINGVIGCLMYLPIAGFAESWQIPYLVQTADFTKTEAATAASMVFLGWAVGSPLMGWLSDLMQQRRLPITVGAAGAAVCISYVIYVPNISHTLLYCMLFLFGIFTSVQIIAFPISREITSSKLSGTAFALTNTIIMLAGLSVYIVGVILDNVWHGHVINNIPSYSLGDYQVAFSIIPLCLIAVVFLSFFLRETYCRQVD